MGSKDERQIRAEWIRRRGDRALRPYLDSLRADGEVVVSARLAADAT